jgi:hypothetical protein
MSIVSRFKEMFSKPWEQSEAPLELKVKACSLAAEARIIRNLELRLKRKGLSNNQRRSDQFFSLQTHRRRDVRFEARATHLARAFLKGIPYGKLEAKCYTNPPMNRAEEIATKFSSFDKRIIAQRFAAWKPH